jgi:hypothetical protein
LVIIQKNSTENDHPKKNKSIIQNNAVKNEQKYETKKQSSIQKEDALTSKLHSTLDQKPIFKKSKKGRRDTYFNYYDSSEDEKSSKEETQNVNMFLTQESFKTSLSK